MILHLPFIFCLLLGHFVFVMQATYSLYHFFFFFLAVLHLYPGVHWINLRRESDFPHEQIKLSLLFMVSICQCKKIEVSFFLFSSLFFLYLLKNRRMGVSKAMCLVNKHPAFPKKKLCNTGTGIPQFQVERHRASPWDLYLAFAMLLIKYFINNVNILDGERTVASHSICTAIATRCSAFICLGPMILKLFIAHVSFFNQSVFGIPCSRDLDKRINSASTS